MCQVDPAEDRLFLMTSNNGDFGMFTRWMLLAFVLVFATAQAKEHPASSPKAGASSPQVTASATAPVAESKHADDPARTNYEKWIAIGTIALAFVTGGLWVATYQLGREAKKSGERQDEALRAIERAYLFVEVSLESNFIPGPLGHSSNLQVTIWNHGKTPAEIIQIRAYAQVLETTPAELIDSPQSEVTLPPGLAVAQNSSYRLGVWANILNEEFSDIRQMYTTLYCLGQVRYRDIFGTERETGFCWFYRDHPGLVPFVIAPNSGLNKRT